MAGTSLTVSDSLIEEGSIQFLSCLQCTFINIKNTTFQNIEPIASSLISVTDVASDGLTIIQKSSFINISIPQSVIFIESAQVSFQDVLMQNITKSDLVATDATSSDYITYLLTLPGGVCFSSNDAIVDFRHSNFTNIDSHCLGLANSALSVEYSIFDNTMLEYTETVLTAAGINGIDADSGITWINVAQTNADLSSSTSIILGHNKFINNKKTLAFWRGNL